MNKDSSFEQRQTLIDEMYVVETTLTLTQAAWDTGQLLYGYIDVHRVYTCISSPRYRPTVKQQQQQQQKKKKFGWINFSTKLGEH
jgi:hypothetical protein